MAEEAARAAGNEQGWVKGWLLRELRDSADELQSGAEMRRTAMDLSNNMDWDAYWERVKIPSRIDLGFSFERCLEKTFSRYLAVDPAASLIEIGCAPGRWLVYFHETYKYRVSGIENSEVGFQRTRDNLQYHGIPGELYREDLQTFCAPQTYDIVISLGFIEHFAAVEDVVAKHLSILKPGGLLIVGIPNFRNVNYWIQKHMDAQLLAAHNTAIMNKKFFADLAKNAALDTVFLDYVGGFEPALFIYERKGKRLVRLLLKTARLLRRIEWFDAFNSPLFSSYLVGIFRSRES